MTAVIDLEGLPRTDRIDWLREHMLKSSVALELRPHDGADVRVHSTLTDLAGVRVLSVQGSGAAAHRTERLARTEDRRFLVVTVLDRGTATFAQRGRAAHLRAGDVVVISSGREYASTFEPRSLRHGFQIPWDQLGLPDRMVGELLAKPIGPGHPLARVVSSHLLGLARSAPGLAEHEREVLQRPTLDLVRALLTTVAGDDGRARGPLAATLGPRILEYLRLHVAERDLSPHRIARAHGISERYLYVVLSRMGVSLGDWIRHERVVGAAADLESPAGSFLTIAAVAYRWGFADHAHFSRCFKAEYGLTPSEWRRRSQ
jgi:AraC-like DNA-binding protein